MNAKTVAAPRRQAPASEQDVAACEAAIGGTLPEWLRSRLLNENGWEVDDRLGLTRGEWRLPVLDRSDRKSRTRTAEDIAWHTQQLHKEAAGVPQGAVVVARAWSPTTRLVLLPDSAHPGQLTTMLWRQNGVAEPLPTPVDPALLGQKPKLLSGVVTAASKASCRCFVITPIRWRRAPSARTILWSAPAADCAPAGSTKAGADGSITAISRRICVPGIVDGSAARKFGSRFAGDIDGPVPQMR